jgi:acyl carrier protein
MSEQNTLRKTSPPNLEQIQEWMVDRIAKLLEIDPEEVDVTVPFDRYGLDSAAAIGLTADLEDWLQQELDPTLLYDYPTIQELSKYLQTLI